MEPQEPKEPKEPQEPQELDGQSLFVPLFFCIRNYLFVFKIVLEVGVNHFLHWDIENYLGFHNWNVQKNIALAL